MRPLLWSAAVGAVLLGAAWLYRVEIYLAVTQPQMLRDPAP